MQYALEVHELTKVIKEKILVDRITFSVEEGEIFGLLGANGSGKTTTFNMLSGLMEPSSGSIKLLGKKKDQNQNYDTKREIGFVTQEDSLYTSLTVKENLEFFASLFGVSSKDKQKRIGKLLDQMKLLDKENALASDLSGGMKKRLNIACSLVHDPKIIFLDEPTVGLDPTLRKEVWSVIEELHKSKKTIILTSHYMDEIERLCGRVAILFKGKLVAYGTPAQLKEKYGLKQMEDVFAYLIKTEN